MNEQELIPHLFRKEFGKITSVLSRTFGIERLALAEDIASETFLTAMETWPYKGIPENPTAWLYVVAKNKAKNYLARQTVFNEKVSPDIAHSEQGTVELTIDLSDESINDSRLRMLFALCHPSISIEAQIGLSLRILCGFGIDEIATALLASSDTINKRLFRAREKLRSESITLDLPANNEIGARLETVLTTLYLLFSEGYYSENEDSVLREELCLEAMQLTHLLLESAVTNQPPANALMALMCFHASRFPARKNESGEIILYNDQDANLWDAGLITKGGEFLKKSSQGKVISRYHLEAQIAFWHTVRADTPEKWENILELYNKLLVIQYSPVAALNRTYALAKARGPAIAIVEAEKLALTGNHFYFTLLGELYRGIDETKSHVLFTQALALAKSNADRGTIRKKIASLHSDR